MCGSSITALGTRLCFDSIRPSFCGRCGRFKTCRACGTNTWWLCTSGMCCQYGANNTGFDIHVNNDCDSCVGVQTRPLTPNSQVCRRRQPLPRDRVVRGRHTGTGAAVILNDFVSPRFAASHQDAGACQLQRSNATISAEADIQAGLCLWVS